MNNLCFFSILLKYNQIKFFLSTEIKIENIRNNLATFYEIGWYYINFSPLDMSFYKCSLCNFPFLLHSH